jgi:thioesterase domain-containing protein
MSLHTLVRVLPGTRCACHIRFHLIGAFMTLAIAARSIENLGAAVALRRSGDRRPFFCVHGAGGNVLNFRELSRAMDGDQPFYGLQAAGVDGMARPRESIEQMAAAYLSEVQRLQPSGPYVLGGYSGGGVVAFEMARQLTRAGGRVALLALLDTFHPRMALRRMTLWSRLGRLRTEGWAYVRAALERQRDLVRMARGGRAIERHVARRETIPFTLRELHLRSAFKVAIARYQPAPWEGRAVLFRATDIAYVFQSGGPDYGWGRDLPDGIEVVAMPGGHHSLLAGPNAVALGRALDAAIARALSK